MKVSLAIAQAHTPYVLYFSRGPGGDDSVLSYQVPPAIPFRSKTRIVSNACSLTRASVAIAPAGPAPITATREHFGDMV